ncbi:type II toxin-antitoxin system RelE/ParE family toxin [Marinobacterium weihaiense]|uniref:Type II toxin-antitoxin system RelE/ParE family toxin n=1 Tax=Marinobacterium weihaiense TaxID=2851016 RepID=A0ABS6MAR2_9GAMM|nr:type II toxin-antitoxin system RelE/ParE family toxin [Marinobacterium weihaiense]MBV0933374.1 type II toxin-antitoxin system RelE/ParE family toxin [Marinobacterium weihaiense]
MKLVWTRLARFDRQQIREHVANENPAAALALDELVSEKAARLVDHPELGRIGRVPGTRELVVHTHYLLVYDLRGDNVRILRLLHAKRQWPPTSRAG